MTVSTTQSTATYLANGATVDFTFSFQVQSAASVVVKLTDSNGTTTTLSPSQYTLVLNPIPAGGAYYPGGTVTYPTSLVPLATGNSVSISRSVPLTQTTTISNQGAFAPQVTELALDNLCFEIQQVAGRTGRNTGVWVSGNAYGYADVVQDGVNGSNTGNYYMCILANTSGTWSTDLAAGYWSLAIDTQQIETYATEAAASAAAASTSASDASNSASAASTSATSAANSATAAASSATAAASSASVASSAAANALASQTAAATSATSASTSATNAATSATNAAASATSASTSATNAANSATSAAASATNAAGTLYSTSSTSVTIGTGTQTFSTQTGKNYGAGQYVIIASAANGANYMTGQVSSYNGTTGALVVSVTATGGSGTHSDWDIAVSGVPGTSGVGTGTVTSVSVVTANGVSGSVSNATTTPAITLTLGAVTPSSVAASGTVTGSNLSGTNTGDQTITLTGDITGSGTGSFATAIGSKKVTTSTINDKAVGATQMGSGAATANQVPLADGAGGVSYGNQLVTSVAGRTGAVTLSNTDISGLGALATASNVTESTISLSDVTTLNASTTKHGFVPKLPNDATKFYDGTGAFSTPSSSSSVVLLGSQTASASSTLDFTSMLSSSYNAYLMVFSDLRFSNGIATLGLRASTNNGVSYDTGNNYAYWVSNSNSNTTTQTNEAGVIGTISYIPLLATAPVLGTGAANAINGEMRFNNPQSSVNYKTFLAELLYQDASGYLHWSHARGMYGSTTAVTALRLVPTVGNFTSGTLYLYGIKNS